MPILHWLNKEDAVTAAKRSAYRLLEEVPDLSYGDPDNENLLVQGDNLESLKALIPYYGGQVKCIYVDPPFNTGQAFDHYDDNLEHSLWLTLMWPRFELLKELLSEEGTIAVHIDDNELAYAIAILDELFGRNNRCYIVTFKQGAATGHKSINPGMVTTTNFILIYAKNKATWKPNRCFVEKKRDTRYNTFIENYEAGYKSWNFKTLSSAFSESYGKKTNEIKKELGKEGYEISLTEFVSENAKRVIRLARPDAGAVGEKTKKLITESIKEPTLIFLQRRENHPDIYLKGGERILFYENKLKEIDGKLVAGEPLTTLWDDLLSNNLHNEGNVNFPKGKKPEALIKRCFDLLSNQGDLILDSFLGSGTSCAVAHKMNRRYIGIEIGEHAQSHCQPRLQSVVDGEQGGISKAVKWKGGGGFRFCKLGDTVFDEYGTLNPEITFPTLAAHIWYLETRTPLNIEASKKKQLSPFLGAHKNTAYYLLYNGILGDKRPQGGNVLTGTILANLPKIDEHPGKIVIYGESCRLGDARLKQANITFKQIPYDVVTL